MQIFNTYIYFYHQVVKEKVTNLQDHNDKNNDQLLRQLSRSLEGLKEKRAEVANVQAAFFENCSIFNNSLKAYLNYEHGSSKPQVKLLKETKFLAEDKYKQSYVT